MLGKPFFDDIINLGIHLLLIESHQENVNTPIMCYQAINNKDKKTKICHDGQNRPHFFQKFALKKTALVIQIACLCWLIIERQNCCDKTMQFASNLFTPSILQTKEVHGLSVMMNELKEVIRYRGEKHLSSFQQHV